MFPTIEEYEQFIYTISSHFPEIRISVLVLKRFGISTAKLEGKLYFQNEIELNILEVIDFSTGRIKSYSYEVYQNKEKKYWYDSWAHPQDKSLAATDPHHKHLPPDMKHHRVPASELTFDRPNLPFLIKEIKKVLLHSN